MTARSTIRTLTCVLLVPFLCLQALATAASAADPGRSVEFRSMAAPSSTVLLTRDSAHRDHARQRPTAPSLFTFIPQHGGDSDPGGLAGAVERHIRCALWTADLRTGRSPPTIS
jgi:hypothetical protein